MDSDEEHAVDEENVSGSASSVSDTELREDRRSVSASDIRGERESSYEPSDHSLYNQDELGLSAEDNRGSRSPLKRPAEQISTYRPFKRQKGVLNTEYLDLLNREIEDAAARVCLDGGPDLPPSQLGLTSWSSIEKQQFFEALSRLGRHDLPGIAERIGSKSEIEIQHYIHLLQAAQKTRQSKGRRSAMEFAEHEAAVEISQPCCHAQEEAADAIALRQERTEQHREEMKWGSNWDITPSLAWKMRRVRDGDPDSATVPKFAHLLHMSNWLALSERAFMNSSIPGNNWSNIDDKPPSMWATAFDDFHSLAVSITRRLVSSTLFFSMSRIRAKKELIPSTRNIVRKQDVEAAVASLGMSPNSKEMWATCARRLRLDVYQEPPDLDDDDDMEVEPMTYGQVEAELSGQPSIHEEREDSLKMSSSDEIDEDDDDDDDEEASAYDAGLESGPDDFDEDADEIRREANEVLWYSATSIDDVSTARQALTLRIATERRQEALAELQDSYASNQAEMEMWNVLQKRPPMELPRVQDPGPVRRSKLDVESIYPLGRDWAERMEYYAEWETLDEKHMGA